jgi:DNA processing protein
VSSLVESRTQLAFVGMHPNRRRDLEERLGGPEQLLRGIGRGRVKVPDHAKAAAVVPCRDRLDQLGDTGTRLVLRGDADYPESLAELPDAPDSLFVRGELAKQPRVAVVGSRACTSYGLQTALAIGVALSAAGYLVVSGLAKGIDTQAHRGALDASTTPTWAVLGCGIDRWYPKANRALGEEILNSGGAVLSEYPPGTPPSGWRFPPRNRIISGLSRAVVVVEATVKGGALITARYALEHSVDVMAVPGDIDRRTSEGCNLLIADGAIPVTSIDDAVEVMSILAPTAAASSDVTTFTIEQIAAGLDTDSPGATLQIARWEMAGILKRNGNLFVGPAGLLPKENRA